MNWRTIDAIALETDPQLSFQLLTAPTAQNLHNDSAQTLSVAPQEYSFPAVTAHPRELSGYSVAPQEHFFPSVRAPSLPAQPGDYSVAFASSAAR